MADNSFKVKNSIVIQGVELELSNATPNYVLAFDGTKFSPTAFVSGAPEVSDSAPSDPLDGSLWFNSSQGRLYSYYDSSWVELSGPIGATGPVGPTGPDRMSVSASEPSSPNSGDLWFNSNQGRLYSYYDSNWVEISGAIGPTGPTGPTGPDRLSVSDDAPSSPNSGDLWFDSSSASLFSYYDSAWIEITGRRGTEGPTGPTGPAQLADVSDSQPSNPQTGQLWYNTSSGTLNVYDGSSWNSV